MPRLPPLWWLLALASTAALGLVLRGAVRRWRKHARQGPAERLGRSLLVACGRVLGREVRGCETLRQAVTNAVVELDGVGRATLEGALAVYEQTRFGSSNAPRAEQLAWERRLARVTAPRSRGETVYTASR